jgi:hypothetical protein
MKVAALYVDPRGPVARRFFAKVNRHGPVPLHARQLGRCWNWTASHDRKGYGQLMCSPGKLQRAHRVSWAVHIGELPAGRCVLHRCDNRSCVNPEHLFLGSIADNNRDMFAKGRGFINEFTKESLAKAAATRRGQPHYSVASPHRMARGEAHGNTTLTAEDVAAIRRDRAAGARLNELATRYGITDGSVCGIVKRRTWRHVP